MPARSLPRARHRARATVALPIVLATLVALAACAGTRHAGGASSDAARPSVHAPPPDETRAAFDDAGVRAAFDRFIVAFNDLDMPRFATLWAREASAVLPFDDTPARLEGREAVLARFTRYFDETRRVRAGPPYLRIRPEAVRVEPFGEAGALVLFEFAVTATNQRARRTLLFAREDGAWRIRHFHGSMAPAPAARDGAPSATPRPGK